MIILLARLAEKLEARMPAHLLHRDRLHLLGHHARQTFVQPHAQRADAFAPQSQGRRQHQGGAIWFQQIGRTDVGLETARDQRHHVHQGFRGLAAFARQGAQFVQCQ